MVSHLYSLGSVVSCSAHVYNNGIICSKIHNIHDQPSFIYNYLNCP
jgi:hypothetical protein